MNKKFLDYIGLERYTEILKLKFQDIIDKRVVLVSNFETLDTPSYSEHKNSIFISDKEWRIPIFDSNESFIEWRLIKIEDNIVNLNSIIFTPSESTNITIDLLVINNEKYTNFNNLLEFIKEKSPILRSSDDTGDYSTVDYVVEGFKLHIIIHGYGENDSLLKISLISNNGENIHKVQVGYADLLTSEDLDVVVVSKVKFDSLLNRVVSLENLVQTLQLTKADSDILINAAGNGINIEDNKISIDSNDNSLLVNQDGVLILNSSTSQYTTINTDYDIFKITLPELESTVNSWALNIDNNKMFKSKAVIALIDNPNSLDITITFPSYITDINSRRWSVKNKVTLDTVPAKNENTIYNGEFNFLFIKYETPVVISNITYGGEVLVLGESVL